MAEHLIIIDGSAYIHRAFHAIPRWERAKDGMNVNAVKGYCSILWGMIRKSLKRYDGWSGTHLVVVFDHKSQNFRHRISSKYKANRPPADPELTAQLPLIRSATIAFGVPSIEMEGYEADDIIATLSRLSARRQIDTTIVSSDKDLTQLVGPFVSMWDPMKKVTEEQRRTYEFARLTASGVYEKFGVYPSEMGDYLALLGDKSDNVDGVPGIGGGTAAELLGAYGSLDGIYENLDKITAKKRRESLEACRESVRISRQLVGLMEDVPIDMDWSDAEIMLPPRLKLYSFLTANSLGEVMKEIDTFIRQEPKEYVRRR